MRKIFHTLHLTLGLVSGLVVFIVASTGAIQAFEDEIRVMLQREYLLVSRSPADTVLVKPSAVMQTMQEQLSHERVEQIRFRYAAYPVKPDWTSPEAPTFLVLTESDHTYSVHPYTGRILGVRDMKSDVLSVALELHTNLLLGRLGGHWHDVGEEIIKWNVAIFTVLLLTGIMLWLPANMRLLRTMLRNSFRVKWRASAIKRNYDLHRVAGFYALWVMLLVAYTAVYWMFDFVQDSSYAVFSVPKTFVIKPKSQKPADVKESSEQNIVQESLYDQALTSTLDFGEPYFVSMQFPQKPTDVLRLVVRYPYRFLRKQSVFYFDRYSGTLLKSDLHEHYTTPDKMRVMNYDLHTGKILGLPGKILWFLSALFVASLPITGTLLWWNKLRMQRR
jgi:uncharacterized iron-regulated membrane protein